MPVSTRFFRFGDLQLLVLDDVRDATVISFSLAGLSSTWVELMVLKSEVCIMMRRQSLRLKAARP